MNFSKFALSAALTLSALCNAQAAVVTYSTGASFASAAGTTTKEGFESAPSASTATSLTFGGVTFSCTGFYCPSFFGQSSSYADEGTSSVYFASQGTATFTFASAINSFGIVIGGAGNVAPIDLLATLSTGGLFTVLNEYSNDSGSFENNRVFFGLISDVAFTSVTFTPSNNADGIYFDTLSYGVTAAAPNNVPEPGSLALLGLGLAAVAVSRKRKQA